MGTIEAVCALGGAELTGKTEVIEQPWRERSPKEEIVYNIFTPDRSIATFRGMCRGPIECSLASICTKKVLFTKGQDNGFVHASIRSASFPQRYESQLKQKGILASNNSDLS